MANNTRLGWASFASYMVVVVGLLQMVMGLTALMNEKFFAGMADNMLVWSLNTWGWIHLAFGLVALMVGTSLFSGTYWSRNLAVLLVTLNLVAQFVFVSVYPLWSVAVMVIDLAVVYALTVRSTAE